MPVSDRPEPEYGLLVRDAELLVAQYDRLQDSPDMQMTMDERRLWLVEVEAVLMALAAAGDAMRPPVDLSACRRQAGWRERAGDLAQRRRWAADAAAQLRLGASALYQALGGGSDFAESARWNQLMRDGRRLATFKIAGHRSRQWPTVTPPDDPRERKRW